MLSIDLLRVTIVALVVVVGLSACGPGPAMPGTPATPAELPSEVETAVEEALSAQTGIPVEEIEVVEAEQREWPDACLGLGEEDEACAQVITPGWEITVRAGGDDYVFRTDEEGDAIRMEQ
jgi:hypothetical protein